MIVSFESETNIVGDVFDKMTAGEFFEKLLALKKNAEAAAGKDKDIIADPRAKK